MFSFVTMVLPMLLFWILIGMAVLWFLRALNNIAIGLREIAERLSAIEETFRRAAARSSS